MTKIIEFKNHQGETLRGLLDRAKSRRGVIFLHGYESTTVSYKFKNIVDKLKGRVNLFRFDFSGCGLSDGKFENMTVKKLSEEIGKAIRVFKKNCPRVKYIILIGHSLGCCAALKFISENYGQVSRVIFLAPPFNHGEILKYLFVFAAKKNKKITWKNYTKYFSRKVFNTAIKKSKRASKAHYISNKYFSENRKIDYQNLFQDLKFDLKDFLIIHGDNDEVVPIESNNKLPKGIGVIKVREGDHDLQGVDMVKQYLEEVVNFILK